MDTLITYSQNREDIIISSFFPDVKKGFYIDVGAYDPIDDSVTKFFYEKGWQGINIEPQTKPFARLEKDRPRDTNLQMGISNKTGFLNLRSYASAGLSTFSDNVKRSYTLKPRERTSSYKDLKIAVDTLKNVLDKHNVSHIHFLKIDVEGLEQEVLEGNDWQKFRPELLCIEANHIEKDWHNFLPKQGYKLILSDGINEYFISKEAEYRVKLFRNTYPEIIVSAPIISYAWQQKIDELEAQLHKVQKALDAQIVEKNKLDQELKELQNKQHSIKYLSKQMPRAVKKHLRKKP